MTRAPADGLDPVRLELISNALRSVTDECFISLMKSAYSTNIKERRDHSTAIVASDGTLVMQAAESLPIHIASMTGLTNTILESYGGRIEEGDLFVANDPHAAGGTHLPDVNVAIPVFIDGRLVAFVCNIAHHADIGGASPGSMSSGLSEIFQEGLRIPLVKLFRRGVLDEDIMRLLLLNVRVPEERRGDYYAQFAAAHLGGRRLCEVCESWGVGTVEQAFREIGERTEARMRSAVTEIPDGTYTFEDVMDDDGLGQSDIAIKVAIEVEGDRIRFDFAGTADQVPGNINVTANATRASVCYVLKALLDPDAPNNQGILAVPEIHAPEGSLLNAVFPAGVALRANTCQRVIDVVLGALAPALPHRAVGAANGSNTSAVFSGTDPRTGRDYVYLETLGGGFGGRACTDGKDGVQVHITNTSNLPVEAIEMEYPLRVESYALVTNSGGAGRQRGGMGLMRRIRPIGHTCLFSGTGERFRHPPWGVFGGAAGAPGAFVLIDGDDRESPLAGKIKDTPVRQEQSVVIRTPGAGGYGRPAERSAVELRRDEASGKFTADYLERHYRSRDGQ